MLNYLRDKWHAARLRARYQRMVQERVLGLLEVAGPRPVSEEPGGWMLLGGPGSKGDESHRAEVRDRTRRLVRENPHARQLLRLLEIYVVGPGLQVEADPVYPAAEPAGVAREADRLWQQFVTANRRHFTYREYARRTWRDGECFLRTFARSGWPPAVRFVDPESIGPTGAHPDSQGIVTDPRDVETPTAYLRIDPVTRELAEAVPAEEMFHTKIGVDTNEKRGVSVFAPILDCLSCFDRWLETELTARKLQASIVLWRKVQGPPSQAAAFADAAEAAAASRFGGADALGPGRTERYRAGTVITTSHATELEFLQPNTNFGDAVPLGRMLLLCLAAGAGLPEFMLTSDASNANFASTMVAEGPAVKLFQSEQEFFAGEFGAIWRWVMGEAVRQRRLPAGFLEEFTPGWTFPRLVTRDRPRERLADARLVEARILSRAEIARRDGVDPEAMQAEIAAENGPA